MNPGHQLFQPTGERIDMTYEAIEAIANINAIVRELDNYYISNEQIQVVFTLF